MRIKGLNVKNMAKLDLWNMGKEKVGEVEISDGVFSNSKKTGVVYEAVKNLMANLRQGTAATKTRGLVSGGGKKPWKQKGTGRARQGSTRAPHWRHGGVTFGPRPRDYSYSIPKKAMRLALKVVLASRLKEEALWVVDRLEIPSAKTKEAVETLAKLGLKKALIVLGEKSESVKRSTRNLKGFKVVQADQLNVLDVLRFPQMLVTESGLRKVEQRLAS
jgi:large subunit ribosomal protein L4